jgi:hypothetical protein
MRTIASWLSVSAATSSAPSAGEKAIAFGLVRGVCVANAPGLGLPDVPFPASTMTSSPLGFGRLLGEFEPDVVHAAETSRIAVVVAEIILRACTDNMMSECA